MSEFPTMLDGLSANHNETVMAGVPIHDDEPVVDRPVPPKE